MGPDLDVYAVYHRHIDYFDVLLGRRSGWPQQPLFGRWAGLYPGRAIYRN